MKTGLYAFYSKRYYATFGYQLFYGCMYAALTLGTAALFKTVEPSLNVIISTYLYSSLAGIAYLYMLVALCTNALSMFFAPASLCPDGARNNRWYLLGKMGISTAKVVFVRWLVCVLSAVVSYVVGFVLTMGIGSLLLFTFEKLYLSFALRTAVIGVLTLMAVVTLTMALAALVKNKLVTQLFALITNGGWIFCFSRVGMFNTLEQLNVENTVRRMTSLHLTSILLLAPVAVAAGYLLLTLLIRCKEYTDAGLDENAFKRLGVEADVLVLERGPHKYNVVVSGPDINGVENDILVPIPDGQPEPRKKKSKKEKEAEKHAE